MAGIVSGLEKSVISRQGCYETEHNIVFYLHLINTSKQDIDLHITDFGLEFELKGSKKHFSFPKRVNSDLAIATFYKGMLRVEVPKFRNKTWRLQ
jgi:HSP20 family molecular chaperone IbpA